MLHIIIDGYNLIRQSRTLSWLDQRNLELGRNALIDRLAEYKRIKDHQITVVFDGMDAPPFSLRQDRIKGIRVRYSEYGESADSLIKRMAAGEAGNALVVSSDQDIVRFSQSRGAAVISCLDFEKRLSAAAMMSGTPSAADEDESAKPLSTKKTGPARRASKKERRNRTRTDQL